MNPQFNSNDVFETDLIAGWDFSITDNLINESDFNIDTSTNIGTYNHSFIHIESLRSVKNILEISYDLFPNIKEHDIELKFRYSTNGYAYTSLDYINDSNLSQIDDEMYLWIKIEVKWTVDFNNLGNTTNTCNCQVDNPFDIGFDFDIPDGTIIFPISNIDIFGTRKVDPIFQSSIIPANDMKIYTAEDTYKVFKTTGYELFLDNGNEEDLDIYFRYTQNQGRDWTEWLKLTNANLERQKYIRVKFTDFQFGFHNKSNHDISIFDMELIGDFQNVTGNNKKLGRYGLKSQCNPLVNGDDECKDNYNDDNPYDSYNKRDYNGQRKNSTKPKSCNACSSSNTPWGSGSVTDSQDFSNVDNFNDFNTFGGFVDTVELLNQYAEAKNHWKFEYFYTDPDEKGIDMVLQENQLLNVFMNKELPVIVPNNEFPTDQVNFSAWGMDLVIQFEVHILRTTFKKRFGVEARPRKGDYMYLCNTNLIYEVEQVLDKREIMNSSIYWRVILKKYEQSANRQFAKTTDGNIAKDLTQSIVKYTTLADLFSDNSAFESDKNNIDINKGNDTENDTNRSAQGTDLVDNVYNLYKGFDNKIEWNNEVIWNSSVIVSDSQYKLSHLLTNKQVTYNYNDNRIEHKHNRAISLWFKSDNYSHNYEYTLLSNYDNDNRLGYKLKLYNNKLSLYINDKLYELPANINEGDWYAFYIGMQQSTNELEIAIYKRQSENAKYLSNNTLLKISGHLYYLANFKFEHNEDIYLGGVDTHFVPSFSGEREREIDNYYMTNIVLWKEPIAKNKRSLVLNQMKIKDSALAILVDDAHKPTKLPFYGNI